MKKKIIYIVLIFIVLLVGILIVANPFSTSQNEKKEVSEAEENSDETSETGGVELPIESDVEDEQFHTESDSEDDQSQQELPSEGGSEVELPEVPIQ